MSRPLPSNTKNVMYVKDADGKHQPVPKHLLLVTQQEGLKAFHEKHPKVKIGPQVCLCDVMTYALSYIKNKGKLQLSGNTHCENKMSREKYLKSLIFH